MHALYRIIADTTRPLPDRVRRVLGLGCEFLGLDVGILARIVDDDYEVLYVSAADDYGIVEGQHFPLGMTYCSHAMYADAPVIITEVKSSALKAHPAYRATGLEAYMAVPVWVDGERFGTLNFSSREVRSAPRDPRDHDFLAAAASFAASALSHQRALAEANVARADMEMFAHAVSHDLRQPLQTLETCVELLDSEQGARMDETGRADLALIANAAERMGATLEAFMRLYRVTEAPLERARVNLSEIVRGLARELDLSDRGLSDRGTSAGAPAETAARRVECRVEWKIADDIWAEGDRGLLHTALQNLIVNAWKFTSTREQAVIEFGCVAGASGERVYFVADNGVGFDTDHAAKLFAPFQQLHKGDTFGGSGLGLATVQRIVHAHLGEVWGESDAGQGARFLFTLG